jgi:DnaK suppressor protein
MQSEPLSDVEVDELATMLRRLHQQLEAQATALVPATEPVQLDQQSVGRVSRIGAIEQQQMDSARARHGAERLRAVVVALSRVQSGDYGYCQQCDEPIGYARLQARPETGLCLQCQQQQEAAR